MKFLISALAAVTLLLAVSCNHQMENSKADSITMEKLEEPSGAGNYESDQNVTADSIANVSQNPVIPSAHNLGNTQTNTDWDKKIIKNAELSIEVTNFDIFSKNLRNKVKQVGGYISSETHQSSDYKIEDILTIRVPVGQFDDAVNMLTEGGNKIIDKTISTEDVTGSLFDTKSRLEAKRNIRLRYLELLKQAKNMDEVLKVQQEINSIQEEMEAASGRISFLSRSSAMSTIHLTCVQVLNPSFKPDENPGFFIQVKEAFASGANWLAALVIGLVSIWPLWLLLTLGFIGYRKWKMPKTKAA